MVVVVVVVEVIRGHGTQDQELPGDSRVQGTFFVLVFLALFHVLVVVEFFFFLLVLILVFVLGFFGLVPKIFVCALALALALG